MNKKKGKVYLIGAGPGDAGLLTLKGAEILRAADCVVFDWLVNPAILEWAGQAEKIYAGKNIKFKKKAMSSPGLTRGSSRLDSRFRGNDKSLKYIEQDETNSLLVRLAKAGKTVARLKGGDPFIFGRGGEEASYLKKRGIPFEVVPGISAGYAVPAYAGIPVTDRRFASLVTFVTAHENPAKTEASVDWRKLAGIGGTLVSFMGVRTLPAVVSSLIEGGRPAKTPAAVIEWGTLPRQRMVTGTLKNIVRLVREKKIESPAVTVIGEVARLSKELAWFHPGKMGANGCRAASPLMGKTVLITRARAQASSLREALEKEGARVLEFPAIKILPPESWQPLDSAIAEIRSFHWLLFTSVNGVESFFGRLAHLRRDSRWLAPVRIGVIGEATEKALESFGLRADLMPKRFTSEALLAELSRAGAVKGQSFLLPRTDIAPDYLRREIEKRGGRVTEVVAYRTVPSRSAQEKRALENWLKTGRVDYVTFTSSSTVKNFFEALPRSQRRRLAPRLVSIGPVTSQTLRSYGCRPHLEAREHSIPGLVNTLIQSIA